MTILILYVGYMFKYPNLLYRVFFKLNGHSKVEKNMSEVGFESVLRMVVLHYTHFLEGHFLGRYYCRHIGRHCLVLYFM